MSTDYPAPAVEDIELIAVLRALADPVRLGIVRKLADGDPHPKNATWWDMDMQKSAMSYHFKLLRESGVTLTLVHGRVHDIQLRRDDLNARFPGLLDALLLADEGTHA